jgi:hypothetical protein
MRRHHLRIPPSWKTHDHSNESIPDRLVAVDGSDRGHEY